MTECRVETVPGSGLPHLKQLAADCDESSHEERKHHEETDLWKPRVRGDSLHPAPESGTEPAAISTSVVAHSQTIGLM
jgi:hypothetical protein